MDKVLEVVSLRKIGDLGYFSWVAAVILFSDSFLLYSINVGWTTITLPVAEKINIVVPIAMALTFGFFVSFVAKLARTVIHYVVGLFMISVRKSIPAVKGVTTTRLKAFAIEHNNAVALSVAETVEKLHDDRDQLRFQLFILVICGAINWTGSADSLLNQTVMLFGDSYVKILNYLLSAVGIIFLWACFFEPPYQPASIELERLEDLIEQPKPPKSPEDKHLAPNKNTLSLLKSDK
jgi:hypothetical protein